MEQTLLFGIVILHRVSLAGISLYRSESGFTGDLLLPTWGASVVFFYVPKAPAPHTIHVMNYHIRRGCGAEID